MVRCGQRRLRDAGYRELLGRFVDSGSFGDVGAVDGTDVPQRSVAYSSPAHDVNLKPHLDRPGAL